MATTLSVLPSLPIVAHDEVELDGESLARADAVARSTLEREPALASWKRFGPRVSTGAGDGPAMFVEDHAALRGSETITQRYDYRMMLLAAEADVVLVHAERDAAFEEFCASRLGLGRCMPVTVASEHADGLIRACLHDEEALGRIVDVARRAGGATLVPYAGTGGAWTLAGRIAERAGTHVHVLGPPPLLSQRVNDKIWLAARLRELLGRRSIPPTWTASGASALAARLRSIARDHERVVIKLPDSAGSYGNFVLESASLRDHSLPEIREWLIGWLGPHLAPTRQLLVGAWEHPVLESPSVQLWIPPPAEGPPIVEGIFRQLLAGPRQAFRGAIPSAVPEPLHSRLAREAVLVGIMLAQLGYVGRCSFDALLVGTDIERAQLHWVECNGRWGGVSLPMTVANRLTGGAPHSIAIQRVEAPDEHDTEALLERLSDQLFRQGARRGVVPLIPAAPSGGSTRADLLAIGTSVADAQTLLEEARRALRA